MAKSKAVRLEMTFEDASERPKYMREVLRDWIEILGPMAKKLKGYPAGDPTDLGGAKLASLNQFPELKPEGEYSFTASFRPNRSDPGQYYRVSWGAGGVKPGFIGQSNIDFPLERTDLLEAFIAWGLTKQELMSIRTYDRHYEGEQNTKDAEVYEMTYGRKSTSPMFPDNRPPPWTGMLIDTSRHPGRYLHRVGYIEAISAQMWLGPKFWAATGASREAVLAAAEWLKEVRSLPNDVFYIKAIDAPHFTSAEGHEAEIQDRLRALLYPHSEEKT